MDMMISKASPVQYKYEQVATRLHSRIVHGEYPDGMLPREVDLVDEMGMSRVTVNRAVRLLAQRGIVRRVRKGGTFIVGHDDDVLSLLHQVGIVMQSQGHFYGELWSDLCGCLMRRSLFPIGVNPFLSADWDANGVVPANPEFPNAIQRLLRAPIRGVIYDGEDYYRHPFLADAHAQNTVCIHSYDAPGDVPPNAVLSDYAAGIRLALAHLIELGHQDIAFLGILAPSHPLSDPSHRRNNPQYQMQKAFMQAMEQAGLQDRAIRILLSQTRRPGAITSDDELRGVLTRPQRPTAIVCEKDYDAVRTVRVARELGLNVPADLAVTGMYNTPWAEENPVKLTTIDFNTKAMAEQAVALLMGDRQPGTPSRREPRLVVRDSCGGANARDMTSVSEGAK